MVMFARKLQRVKKVLQQWNKKVFEKVDQNVKLAEDKVLQLEVIFDANPSEEHKINLYVAKRELEQMLQVEDQFWRQKATLNGLKKKT